MGCGCNDPITSYYALENHVPKSPLDLISFAQFKGSTGVFEYSADYLGSNIGAVPLSLVDGGIVQAWESDNQQMVADAEMWTMQHKMVNVSSSVPPPIHKLAFVRGGVAWRNVLLVDVAVDLDYMLLSFLENAATRGDAQGNIPVLRFDGPIPAGQHPLILTLKSFGEVSMGLKTLATASGDEAMMEMDWVIVN